MAGEQKKMASSTNNNAKIKKQETLNFIFFLYKNRKPLIKMMAIS